MSTKRKSVAPQLKAKVAFAALKNDEPIEYRRIQKSDVNQVSAFIEGVFNQFVAPEFSQDGVDEFMKYIQPDALVNHLSKNYFGIIALVGAEIIGTIVMRDYSHVALFFVDSQHQRLGIGTALFRRALEHCCRHDVNITHITVNSSPNAVTVYKKINFEPTDKEQCVNGIRFVPMVMHMYP
jgi:GNAT superfamily N-acetyltransferase